MSNGTCTSNTFDSPDSSVPPPVSSSHIPSISSLSSPWIILDPDIRIIFDAFLHALSAVDPSVDISQIESPVGSLDSPILSLFPHAPDPEDQHGFSRRGPYCSIDTENPSIKFALSTVLVGGSTIDRSHLVFDVYCRRVSLYEKELVNGKKKRANPKDTYLADEYLYLYLSLTEELVRAWAARLGPKFLFVYGNIASNLADKLFGERDSILDFNDSIRRFDINHPEALRRCDFQPNPDFIRKNISTLEVACAIRDTLPPESTATGYAQCSAVDEGQNVDNNNDNDNSFNDDDSIMDEDCIDVDYGSTLTDDDNDDDDDDDDNVSDFVDDLMHETPDLLDYDSPRPAFAPEVLDSNANSGPSPLFDVDYTMINEYLQMRISSSTSSYSLQQSSAGPRPGSEDLELSTQEKSMVANAEQKRRKFQPLQKARLTVEERRELNLRYLRIAHDKMRREGPTERQRESTRQNAKKSHAKMRQDGHTKRQSEATRQSLKKAHDKKRRDGPSERQSETSREHLKIAHAKMRQDGPTEKQREATRESLKHAHDKTRQSPSAKQIEVRGQNNARGIDAAIKRGQTGPAAQILSLFPESGSERHSIPKGLLRCPAKANCSKKFDFIVSELYGKGKRREFNKTYACLTRHMKKCHKDDDWLKGLGSKRSKWVLERVLEAVGKS